ncbi:hypothetical protein SFK1770_0772 [Shigella flexneri K-1770]|nr:putative transposase [Shigella flexneri VA-6]EGK28101.1 putative transposase [Shigella flexneri VA-6]EIQ04075.1 hypothetical protein SFK1770_4914 [Shigella flexneri K-1770]EIQ18178.1 hypothetical protein SFK1770_0772 [Shigella flexneri K-1770]
MCQVFGVSRSGYYNWVQHEPSDRKQSDERLKLEIKVAISALAKHMEPGGSRRSWQRMASSLVVTDWHVFVRS